MLTCNGPDCNNELVGMKRKFCSNKCKHKFSNNKFQNYEAQKARGLDRKIELIKSKGGACSSCGYNKNIAALCFHHRESDKKELALDARHLSNNSMKTILSELEKCDLLCHICHMELHYPELSNWWDRTDLNRQPTDYSTG